MPETCATSIDRFHRRLCIIDLNQFFMKSRRLYVYTLYLCVRVCVQTGWRIRRVTVAQKLVNEPTGGKEFCT